MEVLLCFLLAFNFYNFLKFDLYKTHTFIHYNTHTHTHREIRKLSLTESHIKNCTTPPRTRSR